MNGATKILNHKGKLNINTLNRRRSIPLRSVFLSQHINFVITFYPPPLSVHNPQHLLLFVWLPLNSWLVMTYTVSHILTDIRSASPAFSSSLLRTCGVDLPPTAAPLREGRMRSRGALLSWPMSSSSSQWAAVTAAYSTVDYWEWV